MKRSKKYKKAREKVKKNIYSIDEAIKLLPEISTTSFSGSINVEIMLNLNEKQKSESYRGSYTLPNKFGKEVKVLAFADPSNIKTAEEADIKGGEELIDKVLKNEVKYDVVLATPAIMPKIGKLGKVLGIKGLMPNPKNGTISNDLKSTIKEFKSGKSNFKMKDGSKITGLIGKIDMTPEQLFENLKVFFDAILSEVKRIGSNPIKSITLSPTMGPSISIDYKELIN